MSPRDDSPRRANGSAGAQIPCILEAVVGAHGAEVEASNDRLRWAVNRRAPGRFAERN